MRNVTIKLRYPHWGLMKCIYKITIGGKFYIGSAQNFHARMYSHGTDLRRALSLYPDFRKTGHHYRWCRYILENQGIEVLPATVIQRCVTDSHLYYAEQFYLNEYIGHADCLNKSPSVPRPACFREGENKKWDVEVGNNWSMNYFNPDDKENTIVSGFAPLTCTGKVNKAEVKRMKKMFDEYAALNDPAFKAK